MDYIKTEEKLIRKELEVTRELKQIEMLSKIDKYIAIHSGNKTSETLSITFKTPEALSLDKKLSLPLKIKGKMLGIGRHKKKYYTEEDLKWSVNFHKSRKFPVKLDHRNTEIASMVGAIDKVFWDEENKVVRYEGHINDETQARNIIDGLVTSVSATIMSVPENNDLLGIVGRQPEYTELSLVVGGSFKDNSLEIAS